MKPSVSIFIGKLTDIFWNIFFLYSLSFIFLCERSHGSSVDCGQMGMSQHCSSFFLPLFQGFQDQEDQGMGGEIMELPFNSRILLWSQNMENYPESPLKKEQQ